MGKKAIKHILIGYDEVTKGYNPSTRKVIISRDVVVMKDNREVKNFNRKPNNKSTKGKRNKFFN